MRNRMLAWVGSTVVVIYVLVNVAHGLAHRDLAIQLALWQSLFVALWFVVGPIVAAILLWTSRSLLGARILVVSMAASLLFGTYYHHVAVSPDNVAYLPAGDHQGLFRSTALLLALSQILGLAVGAWGSLRHGKTFGGYLPESR